MDPIKQLSLTSEQLERVEQIL